MMNKLDFDVLPQARCTNYNLHKAMENIWNGDYQGDRIEQLKSAIENLKSAIWHLYNEIDRIEDFNSLK